MPALAMVRFKSCSGAYLRTSFYASAGIQSLGEHGMSLGLLPPHSSAPILTSNGKDRQRPLGWLVENVFLRQAYSMTRFEFQSVHNSENEGPRTSTFPLALPSTAFGFRISPDTF